MPANTAVLDGSCSSDPDNNIVSYTWTYISGPASLSIVNNSAPKMEVKDFVEGSYLFQLKVTDGGGLTSLDTVQITVNSQTTSSNVDIYAAGERNGIAAYWKNGQVVTLATTNSGATSIAVAGSDVYVAGWEGDGFLYSENVAKYWKNGQEVRLTGPTGAGANAIKIVGNDIYVAGWELTPDKKNGVAKYWKNGQPINLTDGSKDAEATDIVVSGNDVYVAGHENGVAKYWKNGIPVSLTNGSRQAYSHSIAVVGGDVYVAGSESNGSVHLAKYWKNGQAVTLTTGSTVYSSAASIAISLDDVFIAGWEGDFVGRAGGNGAVAKYWRNGQALALTNGSTYGYSSSVAVLGSDVYIGGTEWIEVGKPVAKYWINGQQVKLSDLAQVTSIVVVRK
ncbi:MAG: PKD domain-containing protein [Flavisolibacter sp.]